MSSPILSPKSVSHPRPMLAASAQGAPLLFPLMASPKVDGVRAIVRNGVVYSRSDKPIPNEHVQNLYGHLHGLDGELVVGDAMSPDCFRATQSGVMARYGKPDVCFMAFDHWAMCAPFYQRLAHVLELQTQGQLPEQCHVLAHVTLYSAGELNDYEAECLTLGFEGVMLRRPDALYKFGRSTAREGGLLKVKRFLDAEAEILNTEELVREAQDAVPSALLGAMHVRDVRTGVEFSVGTGFSSEERASLWRIRYHLRGRWIRYRYFPSGGKDRPRFPVFAGLRHALDMESVQEVAHVN